MEQQWYRVYNRCKFDIGVTLLNGESIMIRPNSFQLMTIDDMLYVESICKRDKYFSQKMLVPTNSNGEELDIQQMGVYMDKNEQAHFNDEQITAMLKQTNKKIEAWLDKIEDPSELYAIAEVAKKMQDVLTASKMNLVKTKCANTGFFD